MFRLRWFVLGLFGVAVRNYQRTVRAAKRRLLTRAKYPHRLLTDYEMDDSKEAESYEAASQRA